MTFKIYKKIILVIIILSGLFIYPASSQTAREWVDKGIAFSNLAEFDKAIEAYNEAIAIDPNYIEAWINKGIAFYNLGEYDKAIEANNKAIAIDPNENVPWFNNGMAFFRLGEYNKAIEAYNKVISINPNFIFAWTEIGNSYNKLGEYDKASEAYNKAGEHDKAVTAFNKARALEQKWTSSTNISTPKTNLSLSNTSDTITFSDLGMGIEREFMATASLSTPIGTFNLTSNENPLEVLVKAYGSIDYRLTIIINGYIVKSQDFKAGEGNFSLKMEIKDSPLQKVNKIIVEISAFDLESLGQYEKFIIYGNSQISLLPPPQKPNQVATTPSQTTIQFTPETTRSDTTSIVTIVIIGFIVLIALAQAGKKRSEDEAKMRGYLFLSVIESINKFEPSNKWSTEEGYHGELIGDLKRQFPNVKAEHQTGSSRPDIVIDNIAIEVKGPTDNRALDTLTSKCLKYLSHYDNFIIVLFEPKFSEKHLNEIWESMKKHAEIVGTNIIIIPKNGNSNQYSYKKYEQFSKSKRIPKNQSIPHYYKVLGVSKNSSPDEIKVAYRKLVKLYHPDISYDKDERKFREIQTAYEVLSNPEKRAAYDRFEEDVTWA